MLLHYMLRKISQKPCHGYEILQEIDSKTEGAWRPGAGSIYPILKKLLENGYIQSDQKTGADRRVYSVTAKGLETLKEDEKTFLNSGQKWMAMRTALHRADRAGPARSLPERRHEGAVRDRTGDNQDQEKEIPQKELEYLLKEYILTLERQLDWANVTLTELKPIAGKPRRR